ncbi:MAG: ABC transporter ATP-binding protein [Planctomycetota bacterium]|jgi:multiple sugar transport system ATP-binding protein
MAQVFLKNVTKVFDGNVVAVNNACLEIADKEFMVIVGPSGCGKTTMLRLIAGLEELTAGNIKIGEEIVDNVPPKDRDIAMVFQNYALYPHMTVFQNMAFGLKLRKVPKTQIKERVINTAEMLGIEKLLDRKPRALSGGQRQRVALGRAIVRKPKAFLFDEPLSNLDMKLRVTTRAELKALHYKLQRTSIYVTHDQAEAMTLSDRICVMYNGQIQQVDEPMEVYDKPVNKFVAGFFGMVPMNFFEGSIQIIDGRAFFVLGHNRILLPEKYLSFLDNYKNNHLTLGVRPENLSTKPYHGNSESAIAATVKVIEPLGDRMDVYLESCDGSSFIVNLDPYSKMRIGEKVRIYIDMEKSHIFEAGKMGKNVGLSVR